MGLLDRFFGPPNRARFAKLLIRRLHQAGAPDNFSFDAEQFLIRSDAEHGRLLNLTNVYGDYCAAEPGSRDKVLHAIVRTFCRRNQETPDRFEDASHDILPTVRTPCYLDASKLHFMIQGKPHDDGEPLDELAFQQLNDHLVVALVYDLPESMRFITRKDLEKWGVGLFQVLEVARQNLAQLGTPQYASIGDELYVVSVGDSYDATRLLCLDLIRHMEVQGEHVVAIPNRSTLLVTGTESEIGLTIMADLAEKGLSEPRPISGCLFRLVGDDWEPWLPARDHSTYQKFKLMAVKGLMGDYGDQKGLLEQLYAKTNQDFFVASFNAIKTDAGDVFSYSVWSKDVLTLLPRTDKVYFYQGEGTQSLVAEWDRVIDAASDLLEPEDMHLERWRTSGFPTEEQLAAMGAEKLG